MKERSITLRTHDVQAILAGRKTMHRVLLGTQPLIHTPRELSKWGYSLTKERSKKLVEADLLWFLGQSPFQIGDTLYVKETFAEWGYAYGPKYAYKADFEPRHKGWERDTPNGIGDVERIEKWSSAMHMPREAARIFLRITDVRIERLQDISEEYAKAEGLACISKDFAFMESQGREPTYKYGIPDSDGYPGSNGWPWSEWDTNPIAAFEKMWQETRGTKSWMANPWVWVIRFCRIDKSENF